MNTLVTTSAASLRCRRRWRRTLYVRLFISPLSKNSSDLSGVSPPPADVALPSVPDDTEPVTSRTSSSKSRVAIDIHEIDHDSLRNRVVRIVQDKDLDSLQAFGGGIEGIASVFGSDLVNGINGGGREHEELNITDQAKGFFYFFLQSCKSYTIFLLMISSGLCFSIDFIDQGLETGWHDGVAVLFAVFMLVMCPFLANFRRARKLEEKLANKNKLEITVVRGGVRQIVTISNIVEGDIVCLNKGDRVPADGLLIGGDGLVMDEVLASNVNCDHNPFLLSGSKVIEGEGRMLVTSVCPETAQSKVLGLVVCDPKKRTLLEARIDKPIAYTDNVALVISVIISLGLLLHLLFGKHDDNDGRPELKGKVSVEELMKLLEKILLKPRGKIGILTTSLTALVIGVQHGIPFVITVSISYWNVMMVSDHVNLQNLSACGTMGLVTVLCIDVTGGFMCKEMEVSEFWIGKKDVKAADDDDSEISEVVLETLSHGIGLSDLVPKFSISPIDNLLIYWAKSRWGLSMEFSEQTFEVLDHRKICSNKVGSGVLTRKNGDDEKTQQWHCKGEASAILSMCSHYSDCGGETYAMDNEISKFEQVIKDMEENGLIPIAYAYKQMEDEEFREDGLNLLAIVGFKWPCQEDFKSSIAALENAGVRVKLVSADELLKVRALACELGLFNNMMLEGEEFQQLSRDQKKKILDEIQVMGNFLPEDKFVMVECLKEKGDIVAFFGGLTTSDTLTLKEADIVITEETRSTEMAREISDIVISDKGCISLTRVSMTGRCLYRNIQKLIQLHLIASISGLLITFISTMVSGKSPITVIQLIWLNLIICVLGVLRLILIPRTTQESTTNQSACRTESLITKIMWKTIVIQVLYQAVVMLIFQFKGDAIPKVTEKVINSMIFNIFILCQIFNQLIAMDLKKKEPFEAILYKSCFLVAVGFVAGVHFLIVDFVACLADCIKLNWIQWSICFIIASLSWGFHCFTK